MSKDRQFVTALSRGLDILACFRADRPVLNNGDLSRLTGLPCSSVSRLTHTLIKLGYLDYESTLGTYRLGFKVLPMHSAMLAGAYVRPLILPHMERLAVQGRVRVLLATYEDHSMVAVLAVDGTRPLVSTLEVGGRYGLFGTATGRAYLASCSRGEQIDILSHSTDTQQYSADQMHAELDSAVSSYTRLGYCTSLNTWKQGRQGVAIPIYLRNLGRRVVLSCGTPADQTASRGIDEELGPLLRRSAEDIAHDFARTPSRSKVRCAVSGGAATALQ